MVRDSSICLEFFETKRAGAFLAGGGLLSGYATLKGLAAFTYVAFPILENVVGPAGFAIGFLGLLGVHPKLSDKSPTMANAGVGCVVLGMLSFSVITVTNLGRLVGVVPDTPPVWFPLLLVMAAIGMIAGFLSFGVASLRTEGYSATFGLLLLVPPVIFSVMLAGSVTGYTPAWRAFAISTGQALAYLAIGYTLRTGVTAVEHELTVTEAATS